MLWVNVGMSVCMFSRNKPYAYYENPDIMIMNSFTRMSRDDEQYSPALLKFLTVHCSQTAPWYNDTNPCHNLFLLISAITCIINNSSKNCIYSTSIDFKTGTVFSMNHSF